MPPKSKPQELPDRVSSAFSEAYETHFEKSFATHVAHEDFRKRVKEIFGELLVVKG